MKMKNIKDLIENKEVKEYVEKQSQAFGINENQYLNNCMNNYIGAMKNMKAAIKNNDNSNKNVTEFFKEANLNKKMNNEEIMQYIEKQSQAFGISENKYITNCISNYSDVMKDINIDDKTITDDININESNEKVDVVEQMLVRDEATLKVYKESKDNGEFKANKIAKNKDIGIEK